MLPPDSRVMSCDGPERSHGFHIALIKEWVGARLDDDDFSARVHVDVLPKYPDGGELSFVTGWNPPLISIANVPALAVEIFELQEFTFSRRRASYPFLRNQPLSIPQATVQIEQSEFGVIP